MKWSQKPAAYSVHKLNCVEAHSNKFAGMPNSRGEQLLVCRLLAFVVMVLKAHFQTLFVAASCNKITCSGVFVNIMYLSISCIVGSTAFACMFVFFHQDELGQQMPLLARKGRVLCSLVSHSTRPCCSMSGTQKNVRRSNPCYQR